MFLEVRFFRLSFAVGSSASIVRILNSINKVGANKLLLCIFGFLLTVWSYLVEDSLADPVPTVDIK